MGLPPLDLAPAEPVELRPTPEPDRLVALRRRLGDDLGRDSLPDGQVRFTTVVAMVLDTGARSGELVDQHLAHLAEDHGSVYLVRSPQHGTTAEPDGETLPLSALTQAALERWLPIRAQLVADLQGSATALWVSLFRNHSGVLDDYGNAIERPAGMPLQERGGVCAIRTRPSGRDGQLQRPSPAGTVPFAAPGRVLTITPTWTDQDGQEDEHEPAEDLFAEPHC